MITGDVIRDWSASPPNSLILVLPKSMGNQHSEQLIYGSAPWWAHILAPNTDTWSKTSELQTLKTDVTTNTMYIGPIHTRTNRPSKLDSGDTNVTNCKQCTL